MTIITQIGGVIYLIVILLIKQSSTKRRLKRILLFSFLYSLSTFLIVPIIAPIFGREKIKETEVLEAHSFFYKLANRNYVKPKLNDVLQSVSIDLSENYSYGLKLIYLDANFPFIDKFPLLPHLSHNDGKKIDVSLIYKYPNGKLSNEKPSRSGYGVYEEPNEEEFDQTDTCKKQGNWQYDFPKYLTMGKSNRKLEFSENGTHELIKLILEENDVGKLFIEPHLKNRLKLTSEKVRFHGCKAVRHDDHIHFQLK